MGSGGLGEEGEEVAEFGVGESGDEAGGHEGGFQLGAGDDVGLWETALFAGEVAEDFGAGGAEEDADEFGAVFEFDLGGVKLRSDLPVRLEDGAEQGGAISLTGGEGEVGAEDVAASAVAVAGGAEGDLRVEEEAATGFGIGLAGEGVQSGEPGGGLIKGGAISGHGETRVESAETEGALGFAANGCVFVSGEFLEEGGVIGAEEGFGTQLRRLGFI